METKQKKTPGTTTNNVWVKVLHDETLRNSCSIDRPNHKLERIPTEQNAFSRYVITFSGMQLLPAIHSFMFALVDFTAPQSNTGHITPKVH